MTTEVNIKENLNLNQATEITFVIDTTGSMNPCIANVRKHVEKTCEELFEDIPNLKIGFIAHGDYCDGDRCYTVLPLTDKKEDVFKFIRSAPNTGGGDVAECYELALNLVKTLGWSKDGSGKIVVMIGDADPHSVDYPMNKDKLDWKKELEDLKNIGINVYPLQCLYHQRNVAANSFWSAIGEVCNTPLLKLQDFNESAQIMEGFAYAAAGPASFGAYERKLRSKIEKCELESLSDNASEINTILRGESNKYTNSMEDLKKDE